MAEKVEPMTLFNIDEEAPHELRKEWRGMPEHTSQDLTPDNQLIISFRSHADRVAFGEMIGQKVTRRTKSLWWPKVEINRYSDKQYKYVADDDENTTDTASE